jgi:hypothetical protein
MEKRALALFQEQFSGLTDPSLINEDNSENVQSAYFNDRSLPQKAAAAKEAGNTSVQHAGGPDRMAIKNYQMLTNEEKQDILTWICEDPTEVLNLVLAMKTAVRAQTTDILNEICGELPVEILKAALKNANTKAALQSFKSSNAANDAQASRSGF